MHNEIIALFHTNARLGRIYHHNQPASHRPVTNERPSAVAVDGTAATTTAKTSRGQKIPRIGGSGWPH